MVYPEPEVGKQKLVVFVDFCVDLDTTPLIKTTHFNYHTIITGWIDRDFCRCGQKIAAEETLMDDSEGRIRRSLLILARAFLCCS